ncbi:hypothetical protein D3C76_1045630 [compost metagenome]
MQLLHAIVDLGRRCLIQLLRFIGPKIAYVRNVTVRSGVALAHVIDNHDIDDRCDRKYNRDEQHCA